MFFKSRGKALVISTFSSLDIGKGLMLSRNVNAFGDVFNHFAPFGCV